MRLRCAAAILLLSFFVLPTLSQETPRDRHAMATNHLQRIAAGISERSLNEIQSLSDWKESRSTYRNQLLYMLGLDPLPERSPLRTEITGRIERSNYRIEKIVFQSLPGLYVTGNFYLPKGAPGPLPTILYLCGHAPHPLGAKFNYQDRVAWYVANGFACLILDTLEFGEVPGIHHGTHDLNMWNWISLGYTPAGAEVWSAMRAIDFLETRPEVDSTRIGLTGISGGGAMTWYTAAVDERIAVAAPVCSTITFGSQAAHWRADGQCDCIYYHNTFLWDFPGVGALIAPRPLLMMNGRKDLDFPPDGYHEVFRRSKRVYDFYEAGGSVREVDDDVGHTDAPLFREEAHRWMWRWLRSSTEPFPEAPVSPVLETAEDLACLGRVPFDALNFKIQHSLTKPVSLQPVRSAADWRTRRAELMGELRDKVFRWFPADAIPFETKRMRNTGGWLDRYANYKDVSFQTEVGVRIRAQLLTPKKPSANTPLVVVVKRPGDSLYFMDADELLPLLGHCIVLVVNPRYTETEIPASELTNIERTAAWVGRTIASMQVWDILRAVKWALDEEKVGATSVRTYGKSAMGINALYAALFEDRIGRVILNDPPGSHWSAPALLNVLRVTDIAEVAGALAPRRLVSLTDYPKEFDHAGGIFRLLDAANQISMVGSLPEAVALKEGISTHSK
jgi:cephalosporin-C deacetylase-like acetyl esterase